MEHSNETSYFATAPTGRLIAKFAIPAVISLVIVSLYNIVDQIFIGRGVGYLGNGATTVVFPFTVIATALAQFVGDGAAAHLSLKLGEGDNKSAAKGCGNAITMLIILGIAFFIVGMIFLKPLSWFFGATDITMPYVLDYGYVIVVGLPFLIILTGINSIIRADGSPKYAMAVMAVGAILNVFLDALFVFPLHMGVKGAAIATIIGQIVSFIMSIVYLPRCKTVKIVRDMLKVRMNLAGNVLKLGLSSFISQGSIVVIIIMTNRLLVKYGSLSPYGPEIPLTAMGVVMKVNQILVSILVGIAAGSQPIVGYNYGAGNYIRVKKTFTIAMVAAVIVSAIGFCLFEFCPQALVNLFGAEEALYNNFAVLTFRVYLMFCILTAFQTVSSIFFQAIGHPIKAAAVSLSRQIIFWIPAALILTHFKGVMGVLWSGPVADLLAFLLAFILMGFEMRNLTKLSKEAAPLP